MLLKQSIAAATLSGSALRFVKDKISGTVSAARTAFVGIPVDIRTSSSVYITGTAETVAVCRTWVS